jgi:hypothetical protein
MSGRVALGLVLVVAGALWLLEEADVVELGVRAWLGILLVAVGVGIVLSSRHRGLLVLAGVVLLLVGIPAVLVDDQLFEGGIGETTETPRDADDLEPFRLGIGELTVDLTEEGLPLDEQTVEASVGIGELVVIVPRDVDFRLDAHVGVGEAKALGEEEDGVDVDLELISGTAGSQETTLDLEVGIGELSVEQR